MPSGYRSPANSVGIKSASDVGNLRGGEGYDVKLRIIAKDYVEVVEISSSRSEDEHPFHSALKASLDP